MVSVGVDDPLPAIQDVTLSNVVGGTFTLRVMADALGGEIDEETAEIGYSASAAAVELALEAASSSLGAVQVTKTTSGEFFLCSLRQLRDHHLTTFIYNLVVNHPQPFSQHVPSP